MLRVIAEQDPSYVRTIPDGIYGPETMRAVSVFQRKHALPVTGVTDQSTWEAIVSVYEPALVHQDAAQHVEVDLNPGQIIRNGEKHHALYLAQAILTLLSETYNSIIPPDVTGILDEATADALAVFQQLNDLPMTGHLDKRTWKHLALQFSLAGNLAASRPPYTKQTEY